MAADNILRTYGDLSRKNDVSKEIAYLTAKESSIYNMLGKEKVTDTIVQTLTDTYATAASAAVAEGGDYTAKTLTTPTRLTNIVQVIAWNYKVTRTEQEIQQEHGENELARQTKKALVDWANAAEFDLVRSTLTSGVSGTTSKMSGIIEAISKSTNTTAHTSGTAWSASILKGLMQNNWDNSNGDVATDIFMGSFLRSKTDEFSGNRSQTVMIDSSATKLQDVVDVYQTSSGSLRVHTHRYIQQSGDATGRVLAIRPEKLKVGVLRAPYIDTGLSRSGDYDNRAVVGKMTLKVYNQDSNFFASGFLKA